MGDLQEYIFSPPSSQAAMHQLELETNLSLMFHNHIEGPYLGLLLVEVENAIVTQLTMLNCINPR